MSEAKKPSESKNQMGPADWAALELDYRAGIKSLRQMAEEWQITEGAIRKRAKRDDWVRDLSGKIQAKADAIVAKSLVRNEVRSDSQVRTGGCVPSEAEVVAAGATAVAAVQIRHRSDISRSRDLVIKLLAELEHQTDYQDLYQELGNLMSNPDEKGRDRMHELFRKVIDLSGRVSNMQSLALSLKTLVGLEREAYGIGKNEDTVGRVSPEKVDERLAELMMEAKKHRG